MSNRSMSESEQIPTANLLPIYYKDFVFQKCGDGVEVTDVESFHSGRSKTFFVSPNLKGCYAFVDSTLAHGRLLSEVTAQKIDPNRTTIEFAGWLGEFYKSTVGTHPVFNFVRHAPEGYQFSNSGRQPMRVAMLFRLFSVASAIARYSLKFYANGVPLSFILKFWFSRKFSRHYLKIKPGHGTLALYPTWLFICPNHKWMVEIEDMLTLMSPFVSNGCPNPELNRNHPLIKVMEVLLASNDCAGIICHLEATAKGLRTIFGRNPAIPPKIHHIPLGMKAPQKMFRTGLKQKRTINMLFLNGWAQDPRASFRRGLLDTLKIFQKIGQEFVRTRT